MPATESRIRTPVDMLDHWEATRAHEVYLRQPRNGEYHDITWREAKDQARRIAGALRHLGLLPGDRVALWSKNCAEWFVADLAMMLGGYVSVPIYPSANAETVRYMLQHSGARAVFVGKLDTTQDPHEGIAKETLRLALPYDTISHDYGWEQLLRIAGPLTDYANPDPDRIMTIVYTSGSTGPPKGAVHSFASLGWAGEAVSRHLGGTSQDRVVSYLPLAHITERAYIEMASLYSGGSVGFVESTDSFIADVKRARPTLFISVPRLWAVFRENILRRVGQRKLDFLMRIPVVRASVQRRIRAGLGLTHARVLGCGSAPVSPFLLRWYRRIGMEITEAWGMTEASAYGTLNYPFNPAKIGSIGRPGIDSEVAVSEQGELLFRSPGLMVEYYGRPEDTERAFTQEGFLRTGDLCRIDSEGYVFITGRVADNFKTAKGKYVAPVQVERELAHDCDIELSCVIGRGQPQPAALVQISEEARSRPREKVRASLKATLDRANRRLESHANLDAIVVVAEPWTAENGLLTPTLKIKRQILERRFGERVHGIRGGQVRWEDEL